MKKLEAKHTPAIYKWLLQKINKSVPLEVKHTRGGNTFNFKELAEHQLLYLQAATTERGFAYKLPDDGEWKPFDVIIFKNTDAYVAIIYPGDIVHILKIQTIYKLKEKKIVSLHKDEARRLAFFTMQL